MSLRQKIVFFINIIVCVIVFLLGCAESLETELVQELGESLILIFAFFGALGSVTASRIFLGAKWQFPSLYYGPLSNKSAAQFSFYVGLIIFFSALGACVNEGGLQKKDYLALLISGMLIISVSFIVIFLLRRPRNELTKALRKPHANSDENTLN